MKKLVNQVDILETMRRSILTVSGGFLQTSEWISIHSVQGTRAAVGGLRSKSNVRDDEKTTCRRIT